MSGQSFSAPAYTFEFDTPTVVGYVQSLVPGLSPATDARGIGMRRHGVLVAGAVYEGFNSYNIWVHLAGAPGGHWLNRSFLRAGFVYPFVVCGVRYLRGYVNASNHAARRFNEHIGFKQEARLEGAATDGGDVILYAMRKENCRYV